MSIKLRFGRVILIAGFSVGFAVPAGGQVLQDGDLVINVLRQDPGGQYGGRFLRLRGQNVTFLFEEPANSGYDFEGVGDFIIDSAGRVVFAAGGCGNNSNNTALLRWNPATGQIRELLCIPNIVPPQGPPPGFPTDATHFDGVFALHLTRSLRVTIDDDVNGGVPQAGFVEAYSFAVLYRNQQSPPSRQAALRYIPSTGEVEPGITFLVQAENRALMFADTGATYYAFAGSNSIYRAEADLGIDLRAHTTVGGTDVVVTGRLRLSGRNELVFGGQVLDNTAIPNGTVNCGPTTDDNVPFDGIDSFHVLAGILSVGVLNGGLFVTSNSGAAGYPWLFNLAPRGPFLNPYVCAFFPCNQHYGPYQFFQDPPGFAYSTVHNGRVMGTSDTRVFSVSPTGYQVLANDPQIYAPKDVAAYPAETPALTSASLVVRVDSPVNVLVTDAAGHRIGHDAAGNIVNDFGASGAVLALGPEGHPRIYAVINPPIGTYGLQAVGTGDGPYTIRSYLAETSSGGMFITRTGQAQTGVAEDLSLHIKGPLTQAWLQLGDLNCDNAINQNDVQPFVQALLDPVAYEVQHPLCELFNADMNRDSGVNGGDIQAFLARLVQG